MIEPEEYQDYLKFNERQKHYIKYLINIKHFGLVGYKDKCFHKFIKVFGRELIRNKIYIHICTSEKFSDRFSIYVIEIEKCIECLEYEKYLKKLKKEQKELNRILIKVSQNKKRSRL